MKLYRYKIPAFSLIEVLLYLALFSFLTLMVFNFLYRTQKHFFQISRNSDSFIRSCIALDCLRRDLMCASCKPENWDIKNFVFKRNILNNKTEKIASCVGWQILKKGLYRIAGQYDFTSKRWLKKSYSFMGDHIKEIKLNLQYCQKRDQVVEAKIAYKIIDFASIKNNLQEKVQTVRLENGIL